MRALEAAVVDAKTTLIEAAIHIDSNDPPLDHHEIMQLLHLQIGTLEILCPTPIDDQAARF